MDHPTPAGEETLALRAEHPTVLEPKRPLPVLQTVVIAPAGVGARG